MKIHTVESGPYDDGEYIWNVCKAEEDGEVFNIEVFFNSFDDAYKMIKHFAKSIEPLEFEEKEDE